MPFWVYCQPSPRWRTRQYLWLVFRLMPVPVVITICPRAFTVARPIQVPRYFPAGYHRFDKIAGLKPEVHFLS